jgi:hypothetical protein
MVPVVTVAARDTVWPIRGDTAAQGLLGTLGSRGPPTIAMMA